MRRTISEKRTQPKESKAPKKSKYNVDMSEEGKLKRTYKGILYDSELEMRAYRDWIEPMLEDGTLTEVERQVVYTLQPRFRAQGKEYRAIQYKPDFVLHYASGDTWVIDIKGQLKPIDKMHEKMLRFNHKRIHFDFIGYSKTDGGWVSVDKIVKARQERHKQKHAKGEIDE